MKHFVQLWSIFVFVTLFYLIFARRAYAYLDPGSGSYIFQLIIAFLLGGLFAVKLFWNKIKIFFRNLFSMRKNREKLKD